jgi:hypothetical protein
MPALKPLSRDALPGAVAKAERYRLLNEPRQAESICLDVLTVEPEHQGALVMLILTLTDQFGEQTMAAMQRAREVLPRLQSAYERAYYAGLICERRALAQLTRGGHGSAPAAREWIKDALDCFGEAETLRPAGNDDAILRWNACVRLLDQYAASGDDDQAGGLMMLE